MKLMSLITLFLIISTCVSEASYSDYQFVSRVKNWGIYNGNSVKSDIDLLKAWRISKGNKRIVVAIVDTGIDAQHADLTKNLWHDPNYPEQYGWDFVTNMPNPKDDNGHGTHIAGIVGSQLDLNAGITGIAPNVSIMPVKYYSDANPGSVNLRNTIKAINYAVEHGANVINYSSGGPEFSEGEYLALKNAEAKGVVVVAAAGNDHRDTDLVENYYYPASYRMSNIISVASTDINNNMLPSSNWGRNKVDVAAPGENIFSTLPDGRFGYMSGTSQATAFVTGIVSLVLSERPCLTPVQVKDIILNSVDKCPQLEGKISSEGRVNAYKALVLARDTYTKTCKLIGK